MSSNWFTYIILTTNDKYYTGITTDLFRRFKEHETQKKGAKYTRFNKPSKYVVAWQLSNRSEASKTEATIKKLSRIQKENLIKFPSEIRELTGLKSIKSVNLKDYTI